MYDLSGTIASPVIGFAADGFPILDPLSTIRGHPSVTSSYRLADGEPANPARAPFRATTTARSATTTSSDGHGDLDSCNGMSRDGVYGYYVTASYPWVLACFTGEPDPSFDKALGGPPS